MAKLSNKFIPLLLIAIGINLIVLPFAFKFDEIYYSFISVFSEALVVIGGVLYFLQFVNIRLSGIEERLEISKENKVASVSLIPSESYVEFVEQLKRNQFVYKASIYLPNSNIESLFFLRSLLSAIKIDSKARIIININQIDNTERKNIEEMTSKYYNQIELKAILSKDNQNFSIIILDTTIWVMANFGIEIDSNLIFNVSSYSEQGKSFIEFYNRKWNKSGDIKSIEDEN